MYFTYFTEFFSKNAAKENLKEILLCVAVLTTDRKYFMIIRGNFGWIGLHASIIVPCIFRLSYICWGFSSYKRKNEPGDENREVTNVFFFFAVVWIYSRILPRRFQALHFGSYCIIPLFSVSCKSGGHFRLNFYDCGYRMGKRSIPL